MKIDTAFHPIITGNTALEYFSNWFDNHGVDYSKVYFLTDDNTLNSCLNVFLNHIPDFPEVEVIEVKAGEASKSIEILQNLWKVLIEFKADRNSLLINLGGGVVSDLGGFLAATYMRGIDYINIPTSLLAQVDASVGGKTAIDFDGLKNIVGAFYPPKLVVVSPVFLGTLPPEHFKSGYAEILKHGLIANPNHFEAALQLPDSDSLEFEKLVEDSISIKADIVGKDPWESGIRKVLNFGHTVGHALESVRLESEQPLLHGEAVAYGMMAELKLSAQFAGLDNRIAENTIEQLVHLFGQLTLDYPTIEKAVDLMQADKKNQGGEIKMVLLEEIGKPIYNQAVSPLEIERTMVDLFVMYDAY